MATPRLSRERANASATRLAATIAAALFAGSLWLFYRGLVTYDSILQFREAQSGQFTTIHPPLMAALWRLLLPLGGDALPMLVLEQGLYWGCFLALAVYCIRAGKARWASLAILAGLWPLLLSFSGVIWKDVILATAWGLSAALLLLATHQTGRRFWACWAAAAALLLFGTAMRHNAAPAAIILAAALVGPLVGRPIRAAVFLLTAVAVVIAVPASSRLLHAADSRPVANLVSWDLTGISFFSGKDYRAVTPGRPAQHIDCYSPRLFDACPLVPVGSSGEALDRWRSAVGAEPVAYLEHRGLVFSMLLRFGCAQCRPYIWESGNRSAETELGFHPNAARDALGLVVRGIGFTPLGRPYLWFAWSIGLAALLWKRRSEMDCRILALVSCSGAVYALVYAVAAVTDEFRYIYWLIFAVVLVATASLATAKLGRRDVMLWLVAPALILVALDTAIEVVAPIDRIAGSMATNY